MIHSGNFYLSYEQMQENALYIKMWLMGSGWTINAVSAILGNMQSESTINPGIWQSLDEGNLSGGYGLVQWTPATKYFDFCDSLSIDYPEMDSNLLRITYEVQNNIQWGNDQFGNPPPFDFESFTLSNLPPYDLAMLFLKHYERPANPVQPIRGTQANEWYTFLTGNTPPGPTPTTRRKRNLHKRRRYRK